MTLWRSSFWIQLKSSAIWLSMMTGWLCSHLFLADSKVASHAGCFSFLIWASSLPFLVSPLHPLRMCRAGCRSKQNLFVYWNILDNSSVTSNVISVSSLSIEKQPHSLQRRESQNALHRFCEEIYLRWLMNNKIIVYT